MRRAALAPLLAAAIWGGLYVVSKWAFAAIPPLTLAFLRIALGGGVLLAVVRTTKPSREFSRTDWRGFAILAAWLTLSIATQFVGTDLTNASQGSVVTVLTPVFTLALGVVWFGESLSPRKLGGTALAVVGTVVLLSGQYDLASIAAGNLLGVGFLVVASGTFAAYTVFGTPLIRRYSALETATYATCLSIPPFALLSAWELSRGVGPIPLTVPVVAAVGYLGVVATAGAWYLWYKGLETVSAGTVAVFFFAQPAVGVALGAALLAEPVGPRFLAGATVMAVGVYLVASVNG
ncbi:DMT family transporter [Natronomonas sp. EA1]|uniref:DMT family transporter n=1 Tax=Natronomonas sp. EA1 TaxID=3421655 RepID=UPI003EBEFFF7